MSAIRSRREGAIGVLIIDAPARRNAIDTSMADDIVAALRDLTGDVSCAGILIVGTGGDLSSGADLSEPRPAGVRTRSPRSAMLQAIQASPLPVAAVVDGWAIGIGAAITAAATIAVGSPRARFRLPEIESGTFPFAAAVHLVRRCTPEQVWRWAMSAETIGADDAHAAGLLTHLCADDPVELARALLTPSPDASRAVIEDGVRFLRSARAITDPDRLQLWGDEQMAAAKSRRSAL